MITGLILLSALTLLSVASGKSAILQERISGNTYVEHQAQILAQEAIHHAEQQLFNLDISAKPEDCFSQCSTSFWVDGVLPYALDQQSVQWWLEHGIPLSDRAAYHLIEELYTEEDLEDHRYTIGYYRITALAIVRNNRVITESLNSRRWLKPGHIGPETTTSDCASGGECKRLAWRRLR